MIVGNEGDDTPISYLPEKIRSRATTPPKSFEVGAPCSLNSDLVNNAVMPPSKINKKKIDARTTLKSEIAGQKNDYTV